MATQKSTSPSEALTSRTIVDEAISRLNSKSGVIATIALDRKSGTVLQSTGTVDLMYASSVGTTRTPATLSATAPIPGHTGTDGSIPISEDEGINNFAKMIWTYVNSTSQFVLDMDSEDDLKLLRLRTKKHELVIVPDAKFIFVVVHDVPSS